MREKAVNATPRMVEWVREQLKSITAVDGVNKGRVILWTIQDDAGNKITAALDPELFAGLFSHILQMPYGDETIWRKIEEEDKGWAEFIRKWREEGVIP